MRPLRNTAIPGRGEILEVASPRQFQVERRQPESLRFFIHADSFPGRRSQAHQGSAQCLFGAGPMGGRSQRLMQASRSCNFPLTDHFHDVTAVKIARRLLSASHTDSIALLGSKLRLLKNRHPPPRSPARFPVYAFLGKRRASPRRKCHQFNSTNAPAHLPFFFP